MKIDLINRYASAFGFLAKNIITRIDGFNPYRVKKFEEDDEVSEIIFSYNNNRIEFGIEPFVKNSVLDAFINKEKEQTKIFAPPPMIDFRRGKKLTITPVKNGEIVENWGIEEWEIRMQGILIDGSSVYPTNLVNKIHKIFNYNGLIDVTGIIFGEKDIEFIYLKKIEINPVEGFDDTVRYNIEARSSKEINLNIIN